MSENYLAVYDADLKNKFLIDLDASESWDLVPRQTDWDGWQNRFLQHEARTLYRVEGRWFVVSEHGHAEVWQRLGEAVYEEISAATAAEELKLLGHPTPEELITHVDELTKPPPAQQDANEPRPKPRPRPITNGVRIPVRPELLTMVEEAGLNYDACLAEFWPDDQPATVEEACLRLAGIAHVDPGNLTLAELATMAGEALRRRVAPMAPIAQDESLDERALAIFIVHKDWKKIEIAERLGCNEKSLAPKRCPKLSSAIRAFKDANRANIPHGSKDKITRKIEASDDDEDDR